MSQENETEAKKPSLTKDFLPSDGASCSPSWSPIATAPRDGSVFLAFVPHSQCGFVFAAVITTDGRLACMMSGDDFTKQATEWMPMPPFPENAIAQTRAQKESK